MKVIIDIDDAHEKPSITIQAKEWSEELEEIVSIIKRKHSKRLFGIDEDQTIILNPPSIDYIYAEQRKTFAMTTNGPLELKLKLYEAEDTLEPNGFMRFSKSVIGNLNNIDRFELSFNGNLCVYFHSGHKEYISRKYVTPIKARLKEGRIDI